MNLKKLLSLSKGKYFVWGGQDDWWHKEFITHLLAKIESDKGFTLVGCATRKIEKDGQYLDIGDREVGAPEQASKRQNIYSILFARKGFFLRRFLKNNYLIHGLINTEKLKYCTDIFPEVRQLTNERDLMALMAISGKWGFVNEVLFYKRNWTGSELREGNRGPKTCVWRRMLLPIHQTIQLITSLGRMKSGSNSLKIYGMVVAATTHFIWRLKRSWFSPIYSPICHRVRSMLKKLIKHERALNLN